MLGTAIVLFLLAAVGGIVMATQVFRGRTPPTAIAVAHGLLAATALGLLAWTWLQSTQETVVTIGLVVLLIAALGGFFLLSFHVRGRPHPKPVVVIHALAAVIGVGALLLAFV